MICIMAAIMKKEKPKIESQKSRNPQKEKTKPIPPQSRLVKGLKKDSEGNLIAAEEKPTN